jgi:purine-binding chemotaxis protein CheW
VENNNADQSLVCRVQGRLCALPLGHVMETMRPLPTEAFVGAPDFVLGLAVVRGAPVPVVDAAKLLGAAGVRIDRFVMLKVGTRRIALGVEGVLGVRALPAGALQELPPLLQDAATDVVAAIGLLDAELLLVLRGTRLLSDADWSRVDAAEAAA